MTLALETDWKPVDVRALADVCYGNGDMAAALSSGSFQTLGMIVAPCSVKSMSEIATGVTSTLLSRAADVILKERRRLVLMVRETPLHAGHLRNMAALAELGAVVAPPLPAFYPRPESVAALIDHTVGRILDLFDLDTPLIKRWGEDLPAQSSVHRRKGRDEL